MNYALGIAALGWWLVLACCSGPQAVLEVRPFTLRDQEISQGDDPMAQHEKAMRLYGAVSMAERSERLGQYYTIFWRDGSNEPGELIFRYRQGSKGQRERVSKVPVFSGSGSVEYAFIGRNRVLYGRVHAWRAELYRQGRLVAAQQSYLWQ